VMELGRSSSSSPRTKAKNIQATHTSDRLSRVTLLMTLPLSPLAQMLPTLSVPATRTLRCHLRQPCMITLMLTSQRPVPPMGPTTAILRRLHLSQIRVVRHPYISPRTPTMNHLLQHGAQSCVPRYIIHPLVARRHLPASHASVEEPPRPTTK
jgi:hypothetical protein